MNRGVTGRTWNTNKQNVTSNHSRSSGALVNCVLHQVDEGTDVRSCTGVCEEWISRDELQVSKYVQRSPTGGSCPEHRTGEVFARGERKS